MSETTNTDADDTTTISVTQRRAALYDEMSSRHLAYRRALERHLEAVQQEVVEVQATTVLPEGMSVAFTLSRSYASVRETRATFEAARGALRDSDARNNGDNG